MDRGLLWSALVVLGALDLQVVLPEGVKFAENCVQCLNFVTVGAEFSVFTDRVLHWFSIVDNGDVRHWRLGTVWAYCHRVLVKLTEDHLSSIIYQSTVSYLWQGFATFEHYGAPIEAIVCGPECCLLLIS